MQSKRSECGRRRFGSGARVVDRDERRARRGARYPDPPRSPGRAVAQRRATDEQFTIRGYRKRAPRREISPGCRWCPRRSTASRATSVPKDGDPRATRCTYVTSSRVTRNRTTDPEAEPRRASLDRPDAHRTKRASTKKRVTHRRAPRRLICFHRLFAGSPRRRTDISGPVSEEIESPRANERHRRAYTSTEKKRSKRVPPTRPNRDGVSRRKETDSAERRRRDEKRVKLRSALRTGEALSERRERSALRSLGVR